VQLSGPVFAESAAVGFAADGPGTPAGGDVFKALFSAQSTNCAPNSQPIRHASRHWRGRPSDKMMVNSGGISRCSAITFTPPCDMSVIVQSRGKEPVPNWILASRLH
jgi:hypothetical protein